MARKSKRKSKTNSAPRIEALRPYREGVAKKLADEIFGPQGPGWGTTLTDWKTSP